jgi:hypothetical protein
MLRLQKRDWIILTAFIVAVAIGYGVYRKWTELATSTITGQMRGLL